MILQVRLMEEITMAKRFINSEIFDSDWYLGLSAEAKSFWFYLLLKCDHAGIWTVSMKKFQFVTGNSSTNLDDLVREINSYGEHIIKLDNGKYFLPGFIPFQYGNKLNMNNNAHKGVIKSINMNGVSLKLIKPQVKVKLNPKDKEQDQEQEKEILKGEDDEMKYEDDSTLINPEKKINFGKNVLMTQKQLDDLVSKFGEDITHKCISECDDLKSEYDSGENIADYYVILEMLKRKN